MKDAIAKQKIKMLAYGFLQYQRRYCVNHDYVFMLIKDELLAIQLKGDKQVQTQLEHFVYHPDMVKEEKI